jgi:positive regulator of sigma E activity
MIKMQNKPTFGKPNAPSGEVGVVVAVEDGILRVRPESSQLCEVCGSQSICFPTDGNETLIEADNRAGAVAGDVVSLVQGEGQRIGAALIVFGIPVVTTISGTLLGMNSAADANGGAAAGAIAGLALGMILVRGISKLIGATRPYRPVAVEILGHHKEALHS